MLTNDLLLIKYIKEEAVYLFETANEITYNEFISNPSFKRAFARSIEIIGEASKKLSIEFKSEYDKVNWKAISGMRYKLIHEYFGIDYDIVWDVACNKSNEILNYLLEIGNDFNNQQFLL